MIHIDTYWTAPGRIFPGYEAVVDSKTIPQLLTAGEKLFLLWANQQQELCYAFYDPVKDEWDQKPGKIPGEGAESGPAVVAPGKHPSVVYNDGKIFVLWNNDTTEPRISIVWYDISAYQWSVADTDKNGLETFGPGALVSMGSILYVLAGDPNKENCLCYSVFDIQREQWGGAVEVPKIKNVDMLSALSVNNQIFLAWVDKQAASAVSGNYHQLHYASYNVDENKWSHAQAAAADDETELLLNEGAVPALALVNDESILAICTWRKNPSDHDRVTYSLFSTDQLVNTWSKPVVLIDENDREDSFTANCTFSAAATKDQVYTVWADGNNLHYSGIVFHTQ